MKKGMHFLTVSLLFTLYSQPGHAQLFDENARINYDTNYIKVYRNELTTRVFLARKQNGYRLSEQLIKPGLSYKTNDNLQLGIGYTYSFLNINLAVKMPFINNDDEKYGESKYTDFSVQTNFRNFMIDLYLQWNRGFYLSNPENFIPQRINETSLPHRGDLRSSLVGVNVSYLFNSDRYSYKASFLQNEFQKRSAGSPIAGAEAYWMLCLADSSISSLAGDTSAYFSIGAFNQVDLFSFGVSGGYAYTYVWDERIYVSLAAVMGISGGYQFIHNSENSSTIRQGISGGFTSNLKFSVGYNSNAYYVGFSYTRFSMSQIVPSYAEWMNYSNAYIRFNVVKRFRLNRTIKILRPDTWIF